MRRLNQLYAWVFRYFWLPCPVCGRMFGGHEIGDYTFRDYRTGKQWATCKDHNGRKPR